MLCDADLVKVNKIKEMITRVPDLSYDEKYKTIDLENGFRSVANLNMPNIPSAQSDFVGEFFAESKNMITYLISLLEKNNQ